MPFTAVAVAVHLNQQKHMFCFQKHTRTHHVSDNNCPLISSHQADKFIQWIGCCCKSNEFAIYISNVDDSDSDSDNKCCYCNDYHVCWTCWESLSNSFYRFQHELRELRPTWTYIGTNLTLSHFYHFPHSFDCVFSPFSLLSFIHYTQFSHSHQYFVYDVVSYWTETNYNSANEQRHRTQFAIATSQRVQFAASNRFHLIYSNSRFTQLYRNTSFLSYFVQMCFYEVN